MRCLGRLVDDKKDIGALPFESGGFFHLPIQCDRFGSGELCNNCTKKKERTEAKVSQITGSSLQGAHPSYLHGLVTEPIPFWSHIYDGGWFRLKLESGSIVSEANMAKAKKAAAALPEAPEPELKKKGKKAVKPAVAAAAAAVEAPKRPKKIPPKKADIDTAPMATLAEKPIEIDEENVVRIAVKKVEVAGRTVYLDSRTQKVYDMKCKYMGRLRDDEIVSFPDSDQDS